MIAVVTGASGFIGRNLVGRLRDEGHEVRCLVRPGGGAAPVGVAYTRVDLRDPAAVMACEALVGADTIFHLGGATRARSASAFAAANVTPTRNLLAALATRRLRPRFVYVSSQAAAGPAPSNDRPVTEDDSPKPVEEYGRSKLEAERVVATFSDRIATTIVRPCSVLGQFDRDFLRMFAHAERGVIVYPGVEKHWLSWLHVADVIDGLLAAARGEAAVNRTYFLASQQPIEWLTLGRAIEAVIGRRVTHLNVPGALVRAAAHIGDVVGAFMLETPLLNSNKVTLSRQPFWVCSAERASKEIGWRQSRSLPDAVRDTYLWYQQSGWLSGPHRTAVAVA
jgi:nucleoside-diphosphate-sugar epimerase